MTRSVAGDRYRKFAITCPFHDDTFWARLKTDNPAQWADAVAFDAAVRNGSARANTHGHPLRGQFFLHHQRVPLDQVALHPRTGKDRVGDVDPDAPGCGPWTCPHPGAPATGVAGPATVPAREVA